MSEAIIGPTSRRRRPFPGRNPQRIRCPQCGGEGEDRLGQILMEVRAYLAGRRDAGERR